MNLLDLQIKSALLDCLESGKGLPSVQPETDRLYLTSQFLGLALLLESEQRTSKSIKNQVREEIINHLESRSAAILSDIGFVLQASSRSYERLMRVVSASKSGGRTTLLDVVRAFTGQALPFSKASDCEWLNDEILEIFSDIFGVRSDWLAGKEGSTCAPIKENSQPQKVLLVGEQPFKDIEVVDSKLILIKERSVMGREVTMLVNAFSIKNIALAHSNIIEASALVHFEHANTNTVFKPIIESGVANMLPVFIAKVGYSATRDFLMGDMTPNELVAKSTLKQASSPMIEAWYAE